MSHKGNVVVCCGHFLPHVGGVERYTHSLWTRLAQRGWGVTVLTTNTNGVSERELLDGLNVVRLPVFSLLDRRAPLIRPSRLLLETWREMKQNPPDVFVMNTRFFPTSVLAVLLAGRTGRPLVHIEHGSSFPRVNRKAIDLMIRCFDRVVGGWVLRHADVRFGVSRAVCNFVESMGCPGAGVLHNAVDLETSIPAKIDFRAQLGVGRDEVLVVYAGRLVEEKGPLDLLEAWTHLRNHDRVHLAYAGAGPLQERLSSTAAQTRGLHVLGLLKPEEVHDLMRAADICAFPSTCAEGLPTVLLEAGAAGTAIVATPMGGTTEIVSSANLGTIVPPHDPAALAAALDVLVANPELRQQLGKNVQAVVRDQFNWDTVADKMDATLMQLCPAEQPESVAMHGG